MTSETLLALLQFADGLFPSGGFAHSLGLETYAHAGIVCDRAGLAAFLRAYLEGSAGPGEAVAVAVAARHAAAGDLAGCLAVDARLDTMRNVPETRAASRQMGRQSARVAAALSADDLLLALHRTIDAGGTPGHHAVVFGAVAGRHAVPTAAAAAAFLSSTCALLVNASLRLLPVGQLEGQCVLAELRPVVARLAEAAATADLDGMWGFSPGLELAALAHAELPTRLFRS